MLTYRITASVSYPKEKIRELIGSELSRMGVILITANSKVKIIFDAPDDEAAGEIAQLFIDHELETSGPSGWNGILIVEKGSLDKSGVFRAEARVKEIDLPPRVNEQDDG